MSKKWIGSIILIALVIVIAIVAAPKNKAEKQVATEKNGTAGIAAMKQLNGVKYQAAVEALKVELVSETSEEAEEAQVEETEPENKEENPVEKKSDKKEEFWKKHFVVNVEDTLNVRKKASQKSEQVGILFANAGGKILKSKGGWMKIQSGHVKGYVKKSYCLTGKKAEKFAKKHGFYHAIALSSGLRVRYAASTDSKIYTVVEEGSSLKTCAKPCKKEGWVAVNYNGKRAFVSEEFVRVSLSFGKGLTMKEYQKRLAEEAAKQKAAEEAAKKAAAASQQVSSSSSSSSSASGTQHSSVAADVDDVTLLAALICCEAGSASYEGKLAVGSVVCNRIRSGRFPNTLRGVIYQAGQFGPAHSGALARRIRGSINSGCYRAARAALAGADNVGGALFFRSARSGIQGLILGGNVFY